MALISALRGQGLDALMNTVAGIVGAARTPICFHVQAVDGKALSWLYEHAEIVERKDDGATIIINAMIEPENVNRFASQFSYHPHAGSFG